ncbi:MAG TPA: biopolymer transporter ExbD [Patescibacteria group bacterium]|nr:biopolymer transporter ExbD [Patescibacteria group bacterium]
MAMHIGRPDDEDGPGILAEINTTPLIDVMLVLLIMLIITIPVQTHAVKLDLPNGAMVASTPPPAVTIEVAADGSLRWDGQIIADPPDLEVRLQALTAIPEQPELHLRADPNAPYRQVAAVLAAAQRHGVAKLGIMDGEGGGR